MKEYIFKQYLDNVLEHLNISVEDLLIKTKERRMTEARFLLYYLCHKRGIKMVEIQSYMKSQGYDVALSIIKYGLDRAKEIVENDSDYIFIVKKLSNLDGLEVEEEKGDFDIQQEQGGGGQVGTFSFTQDNTKSSHQDIKEDSIHNFCPSCGKQILIQGNFCSQCGNKLI